MTVTAEPADVKAAAGNLVGHAAGYVAFRTIAIGQRHGLFEALAGRDAPVTPEQFATERDLDPLYTRVWLRAAHAAGVLERSNGGYVLPPALAVALLDEDHGGHVGPLFGVMEQPEIFDEFEARLSSGERLWWDQCSHDFIAAVSRTGRPFYNRLVPGGLSQVRGLAEVLDQGATVLELATGSGRGIVRMAQQYPNCRFVGVDGDQYSLGRAQDLIDRAGCGDDVELVHSTFEDFRRDERFDVALVNISMHECRDLKLVTQNIHASLRPGGYFVVSDFPFPDDSDTARLRTPGGVVMSGIQFFEALIEDQLLPMDAYVELMDGAGFTDIDVFDISPVHAVAHGRRPT